MEGWMTPCVSSGLKHSGGEGTLLLRRAPLSWTAYLVSSISAVVNTDAHRQLEDLCRRCPLGLWRLPHTSHPRSHVPQSLRPIRSQGKRQSGWWTREPWASWVGAQGCHAWKCRLLPRVCSSIVAQTSGQVGLVKSSSFQSSLLHTPVIQGSCRISHEISSHTSFCITNRTLMFGVSCSNHLQQQLQLNG